MTAANPVRWGFLGAGNIARTALGPAVHRASDAVLHAAAARDPQRARDLGLAGPAYAGYAELLADPDVEAVYIALHNDAHLPWTLAALEAGKHVLCEKPLGLDAGEVRQMAAAAAAADRLCVEAVWSRWHPRTQAAQRLLAAGGLGAVRAVSAGFTFDADLTGNYRLDPAHGGGALYDIGCYALSAILWAFGNGTVSEAVGRMVLGGGGVDMTIDAELRVRGGLGEGSAQLHASMAETGRQWLVVQAEHGRLELGGEPGGNDTFMSRDAPSELVVSTADGEHRESFGPVDPYQLMVEAVSARIRGDEAWLLPLEESVRVADGLDRIRVAAGIGSPADEPS